MYEQGLTEMVRKEGSETTGNYLFCLYVTRHLWRSFPTIIVFLGCDDELPAADGDISETWFHFSSSNLCLRDIIGTHVASTY